MVKLTYRYVQFQYFKWTDLWDDICITTYLSQFWDPARLFWGLGPILYCWSSECWGECPPGSQSFEEELCGHSETCCQAGSSLHCSALLLKQTEREIKLKSPTEKTPWKNQSYILNLPAAKLVWTVEVGLTQSLPLSVTRGEAKLTKPL